MPGEEQQSAAKHARSGSLFSPGRRAAQHGASSMDMQDAEQQAAQQYMMQQQQAQLQQQGQQQGTPDFGFAPQPGQPGFPGQQWMR